VGLLGVYLCSSKRNSFLNLCRFTWSFASAINFLCWVGALIFAAWWVYLFGVLIYIKNKTA
jgi:hypothetical protein